MQKPNALIAGIALVLAGCQPTQNSRTWETVKAVPRTGPGIQNRSTVYAKHLHKTLQQAGVEHKVVTFRFRYPTILKVDRTGEDVAVIYKDASSPAQPWWLMSECLWNPVWLPVGPVQRQVDFYLRRPSAIVSVAEFPAGSHEPVKLRFKCPEISRNVAALADARPAKKSLKKAEAQNRHPAKGRRGNPRAPKAEPVPQVNPPTVRSRHEGARRAA